MESRFVLAVLSFAAALVFGEAQANSTLVWPNPNPGEKFAVQGNCAQHGISSVEPKIDLKLSTLACQGASSQMLRIFYREGPQDCVYIDNFNRDGDRFRAFFIPLRTSDEWIAFSSFPPGGVRLRYGCQGQIFKDSCGNSFGLPDMPASDDPKDVIKISTPGGYNGEFSCPLTLAGDKKLVGGCGAWKAVKESGDCTPAIMSDTSAAGGSDPAPGVPPTAPVGIPDTAGPAGFPGPAAPVGFPPPAAPVGFPVPAAPVGIPDPDVPITDGNAP